MAVESISEQHGLVAMRESDLSVLSVGISTGGDAEMKMVRALPDRHIVATTLDVQGARQAEAKIAAAGLSQQIAVKVEDVSDESLPYDPESFDYVYARLVLHYLSAQKLEVALSSLYRVLKTSGRLFVVVRSADTDEARQPDNTFDATTQLTTYKTPSGTIATRYFHTQESISKALQKQGFAVSSITQYDEPLSPSFNRDNDVWVMNKVIEVLAEKNM